MAALAYLSRPGSQRPINPTGLVLIATAARKLSERGLGRLLSTPATTALAQVAAHTPEHILRKLVTPLCTTLTPVRNRLPATTIAAITLTALTTTPVSTAIGYLPSLRTYDRYPSLAAIGARTVIVSGGGDPLTPPEHARELAFAIPLPQTPRQRAQFRTRLVALSCVVVCAMQPPATVVLKTIVAERSSSSSSMCAVLGVQPFKVASHEPRSSASMVSMSRTRGA